MASRSRPRPWRTGRRAGGSPDPGRGVRRPRPQLPRLKGGVASVVEAESWADGEKVRKFMGKIGNDLIPEDPNVRNDGKDGGNDTSNNNFVLASPLYVWWRMIFIWKANTVKSPSVVQHSRLGNPRTKWRFLAGKIIYTCENFQQAMFDEEEEPLASGHCPIRCNQEVHDCYTTSSGWKPLAAQASALSRGSLQTGHPKKECNASCSLYIHWLYVYIYVYTRDGPRSMEVSEVIGVPLVKKFTNMKSHGISSFTKPVFHTLSTSKKICWKQRQVA